MTVEEKTKRLTDIMASFIGYTAIHLPDDIVLKLEELRDAEEYPAALSIYEMMFENMRLASELGRPSCQDTGLVQFRIECGSRFPLINELGEILHDAVIKATVGQSHEVAHRLGRHLGIQLAFHLPAVAHHNRKHRMLRHTFTLLLIFRGHPRTQ